MSRRIKDSGCVGKDVGLMRQWISDFIVKALGYGTETRDGIHVIQKS